MAYSFDPTGEYLQNRVIGEIINLVKTPGSDYLFVLPEQGAFFYETLEIKHVKTDGTWSILSPESDYEQGFQYVDAIDKLNKFICYGIKLTDAMKTGTLIINYNCLGDDFKLDPSVKDNILQQEKRDPLFTTWEDVRQTFSLTAIDIATTDYPWSNTDSTKISAAIKLLEKLGLVVHLRPEFLPTPDTVKYIPAKEEIGLGRVENYAPATIEDAKKGTDNDKYMTPLSTRASVESLVNNTLNLIGYSVPIPYAANLNLNDPLQPVSYDNNVYVPMPEAIPFTTSGTFERDKFVLLVSNTKSSWVSKIFTIIGAEPKNSLGGIILDTQESFTAAIKIRGVLNGIIELVRGVDFVVDDGKIIVYYQLEENDELFFVYKELGSRVPDEKPYYKTATVTGPVYTFDLSGIGYRKEADVRVTLNDMIILVPVKDYTLNAGKLNVIFRLELGDTLEIQDQDGLPDLGVHQMRSILNTSAT